MKKILTPQNQNGIIQNLTAEEISQIEIDKQPLHVLPQHPKLEGSWIFASRI